MTRVTKAMPDADCVCFRAFIEAAHGGGAYVRFPYDLRELRGRGRAKVEAHFDGLPYRGSIVNMGLKSDDGKTIYVLGVLKSIRECLEKSIGDEIEVQVHFLEEKK